MALKKSLKFIHSMRIRIINFIPHIYGNLQTGHSIDSVGYYRHCITRYTGKMVKGIKCTI